jgi:hypothetical protein
MSKNIGSNHRMNSVTTYPFNLMGNVWEKSYSYFGRFTY